MIRLALRLFLISLALNACTGSPPVQLFMLETVNSDNPVIRRFEKQQIIGVGPISVPVMLENKKIVSRLPGNAIQVSEFQQWVSPLPDIFLEALTHNLALLLPQHIFRAYPWSAHGTVDRQIIIDIIRFDATPGMSANLEANWTIKNEQTNIVIKHGHTGLAQPLTDSSYPGRVRALSKLLADFSRELSIALLSIRNCEPSC